MFHSLTRCRLSCRASSGMTLFRSASTSNIHSAAPTQMLLHYWRRQVYEADIDALSLVKAEAERWFSSTIKFDSIGDALDPAQTRMYPNLARFLQFMIMFPVSNAEAECSFSTLKRLKTMGQKRLNGLVLLNVHNEINVKTDSVINVFAKKKQKDDVCPQNFFLSCICH